MDKQEQKYLSFAMRILGDFGVTIAAPAVAGTFLGIWLDKKFQTTPWFLLFCLVFALIFTGIIVYKKAKKYGKEFEHLEK